MSLLHHTHITRPRQKEAHCTHWSGNTYKVGRNALQAHYFVAMSAFNQPAAYAQQHAALNRTYQGSPKHGVQYDLGATRDASAVHLRFQSWGISCIGHFGYEANKSKSGEEELASTPEASSHLEQIKVASKRPEAQAEKKKRRLKKTVAKESAIMKYKEIDSGHSPETVEVTFTAQDKERIKAFEEAYMQRFRKKPPRDFYRPYVIKLITTSFPATVARHLDGLIASFGLKSAESVMSCRSEILFHNKDVLKKRFHDACNLYGWSAEEGVRALRKVATMIASTIERQKESRKQLMELLGVSGDVVSKMVLRFPDIIGSSPKTIASKISLLERHLQLPAEDICQMAVKQPFFLSLAEERLVMRVAFFVQLFYTIHDFINRSGMGTATLVRATPLAGEPAAVLEPGMVIPREVGMMLKAQPSLLGTTALNLNYKLAVLMACCQKDSQWMSALAKNSVTTLARYLICGEKRFGRLKYWQSLQPAQELSFGTLLMEKDDEFNTRCPEFQSWWLDEEIKMKEGNWKGMIPLNLK